MKDKVLHQGYDGLVPAILTCEHSLTEVEHLCPTSQQGEIILLCPTSLTYIARWRVFLDNSSCLFWAGWDVVKLLLLLLETLGGSDQHRALSCAGRSGTALRKGEKNQLGFNSSIFLSEDLGGIKGFQAIHCVAPGLGYSEM